MQNNKFNQLFNKIDYNTYHNICNALDISIISTCLTDSILQSQPPILDNSLAVLEISLLLTRVYLSFSNNKNNTKDINEIKILYQQFINNYNDLNKTMSFNEVIQIHTMFNYLLYKGYLSKDKNFKFGTQEAREISAISGANIIMGTGVCRHISSMLTDILNAYGIDASYLGCYTKIFNLNITLLQEQKYSKEELITWINTHIPDKEEKYLTYSIIDNYEKNGFFIELSYNLKDDKNPFHRIFGNHAICFAKKDEKSYFLDPTQNRIYRASESNKNTLYDNTNDSIKIKEISSLILNNPKSYLNLKKKLNEPIIHISPEEEQHLINSTLNICKQNTDIFEQFYNDNSELYSEITNKLTRIKKR